MAIKLPSTDRTLDMVLEIILHHVDTVTTSKILADLMSLPGNQTFRDIIDDLNDRFTQVVKDRARNKAFGDAISGMGRTPNYDQED